MLIVYLCDYCLSIFNTYSGQSLYLKTHAARVFVGLGQVEALVFLTCCWLCQTASMQSQLMMERRHRGIQGVFWERIAKTPSLIWFNWQKDMFKQVPFLWLSSGCEGAKALRSYGYQNLIAFVSIRKPGNYFRGSQPHDRWDTICGIGKPFNQQQAAKLRRFVISMSGKMIFVWIWNWMWRRLTIK